MQCIRPLKASQRADLSITFSPKDAIKGLQPFPIVCRKCLPCRLNTAREKAVRCWHESKEHEYSIFLTLTYDDKLVGDLNPRLHYPDFQNFMKRLRESTPNKISYMVTGEYGDKNKRPHWHVIIFNYRPSDATLERTTEIGNQVFNSKELYKLWSLGNIEFGDVTIDSASYVARYAAKKLCHGNDQDHDFHPIHKTSSKRAIGRSWIEKNYNFTFTNGYINLPNGSKTNIPRYYVDWCKKYQPILYKHYVTQVRPKIQKLAEQQQQKEDSEYLQQLELQRSVTPTNEGVTLPNTKKKLKEIILKLKFKRLQEKLKL